MNDKPRRIPLSFVNAVLTKAYLHYAHYYFTSPSTLMLAKFELPNHGFDESSRVCVTNCPRCLRSNRIAIRKGSSTFGKQ
ncbi:unnamed protein product [Schistosoma rodhaini]|uniref:Uncharacterized protein n=1 Tax=Schistosoma rodhaini TaxID=6188 RepID=A0AA85EXA4_9TREM|nr:unnamed protein product [Schistosoma rodhaini]